jgi:hypothetical protein
MRKRGVYTAPAIVGVGAFIPVGVSVKRETGATRLRKLYSIVF